MDDYTTLGIAPDSDQATIEAAYRRRLAEYDPAKLETSSPELKALAGQRRAEIEAAYKALSSGVAEDTAAPERERRPLLTRRELLWSIGGALVALLLLGVLWVTVGQEEPQPNMIVINQQAPEFDLPTLDGGRVRLNQFRGKVVLVNFWASWCVPCQAETPDLVNSYRRLKDEGLVIIGININDAAESEADMRTFVERYTIEYPIAIDQDNSAQRAFSIYPIPVSYFIDENGTIRYIRNGELTEEEIEQTFRQLQ